ncbi:hypothetical protein [Emticicia soli]|uniref:Uncharacterized protein n=1 Tax=Emticicia soli TaxID=2027878 RepID=A0ABW5J209_9BACT
MEPNTIYTPEELCEILRADWTVANSIRLPIFAQKNFMDTFVLREPSKNVFVKFFKSFLVNRNGCVPTRSVLECIKTLKPRDFQIDVKREQLIKLLEYFKEKNCLAVKICFGLDKPLSQNGRIQLILSGNFCDTGNYETTQDNPYRNAEGEIEYFLNFSNKKISQEQFKNYHQTLFGEITNPDEGVVAGYLISTDTFLSLLKKEAYFGNARTIRFALAMNKFTTGRDQSRQQILMLKIKSPQIKNYYMWLFDRNHVECDTLDCPPRMGCTV